MEYRIGDKKVRIYTQHLEEINSGKEGVVYKYRGKCLKLYHDKPKKFVLKPRDCEYMTTLTTERVLLPEATVYDKKHMMRGYITSPYIAEEKDIYDITGEAFFKEKKEIEKELICLGENLVSVDDFWSGNFKYDGTFYFLDPGSYIVQWYASSIDIHDIVDSNLDAFHQFLVNCVIFKYIQDFLDDPIAYYDVFNEIHQQYLQSKSVNKMEYISKFIIPNIPLKESIKELIKYHKI